MIGLNFTAEARADGKSSNRDIRHKSKALVLQAMTDYARDDVVAAHGHMQEAAFLCKGANLNMRPAFDWLVKGFDPGLASILHRDAKSLRVVLNATCNPTEYLDAVIDLDDPNGAALLAACCPKSPGDCGDFGTSLRYQEFILRALASKNPELAGAIFGALPADVSWLNLRRKNPLPAATNTMNRGAVKAAFNATFRPNP